jgi:hypothetical protein
MVFLPEATDTLFRVGMDILVRLRASTPEGNKQYAESARFNLNFQGFSL